MTREKLERVVAFIFASPTFRGVETGKAAHGKLMQSLLGLSQIALPLGIDSYIIALYESRNLKLLLLLT